MALVDTSSVTIAIMKIYCVIFLLWCCINLSLTINDGGVFGRIRSGFQIARKLLGLDKAKGVAQLVTDAFGKSHKKGDGGEAGNNIFSGFLRVLGLDSKKIGAIAVNAIIFVAHLISTSLSNFNPQLTHARAVKKGTPLDWMMNNSEVLSMFEHIKDKELPNYIVEYIKERSLDEETGCIQLLVCKSAPFVWGMQRALQKTPNETMSKGTKALFAHLPKMEEVAEHGDRCELKHPYCFFYV